LQRRANGPPLYFLYVGCDAIDLIWWRYDLKNEWNLYGDRA